MVPIEDGVSGLNAYISNTSPDEIDVCLHCDAEHCSGACKKIKNYHKMRKYRKLAIRCVDTGEVFCSIKDAARKCDIPYQRIYGVVTGRQKKCRGIKFERLEV